MSKPVAGQWYELDGKRMYCIGLKTNGRAYMEHDNENFEVLTEQRQRYLKHLPDCTGWDWEPEAFPQYWTTLETGGQAAFIKLISESQWVCVRKDGSETQRNNYVLREMLLRDRTRLTEQQALALLDEPVEVKQDPPVSDFASAVGFVETTICKDDDLMWTWHCQIAMAIQDEMGSRIAHADANRCAARAMKMLFGADVEKTKHWNITVKPQPAEDPEEWVVQDRVPVRKCDRIS